MRDYRKPQKLDLSGWQSAGRMEFEIVKLMNPHLKERAEAMTEQNQGVQPVPGSDSAAFDRAMIAAGFAQPERNERGALLYQRDADRYAGWEIGRDAPAAIPAPEGGDLTWTAAPRLVEWGAGMMVCDVALDVDSTATIYAHSDDLGKVHAALAAQPQAAPVALTYDDAEALVEALSDWSGYVVEDTAPETLEKHVRRVLASHGITAPKEPTNDR